MSGGLAERVGHWADGVLDQQLKDRIKLSMQLPLAWTAGLKNITARCEVCHRSMTMRHFSDRKAGIRMDDRWYCSSRCFSSAAEKQFARQITSQQSSGWSQTPHVARMPLELLLISRGCLTSDQSQQALKEQKATRGEIGDILTRLGYVTEKQVTAARAEQWGYPVFSVQKNELRTGVHIPPTLIRLYSTLPLHHTAASNRLLVGFVHCVEYGLLYAIEQMTGCKTEPCFVTPSDFKAQIEQIDQMQLQNPGANADGNEPCKTEANGEERNWNELKYDDPRSSAQMADILCSHAVELEADDACIGKSRDYLWARLKSGSDTVDLLFKAS